jgi:hypothetical protein
MDKPHPDEYNPYYGKYVALVDTDDIVATLTAQANDTVALLSNLNESQGDHRYAPDKWSIKQMLGHIIDTERIFAYRALRIARNDPKPLEGFEQDDYVRNGGFEQNTLSGLIEEFWALRRSTAFLFAHIAPDACLLRGVANQSEVSVRAIAWIIAGHELHHRAILKDKYLAA